MVSNSETVLSQGDKIPPRVEKKICKSYKMFPDIFLILIKKKKQLKDYTEFCIKTFKDAISTKSDLKQIFQPWKLDFPIIFIDQFYHLKSNDAWTTGCVCFSFVLEFMLSLLAENED